MELKDVWVFELPAYHEQGVNEHFWARICRVEYEVISVCSIAGSDGRLILNI